MNNISNRSADFVKDLGVHVSKKLSWSLICIATPKRTSKECNVNLYSSRGLVFIYEIIRRVYVMANLEYCCYSWSPILVRNINVLENVLRTFTRRVFFFNVVCDK